MKQDGHAMRGHIVFEDGNLHVPKNQPLLQQLLELYHPKRSKWAVIDHESES